MSTMYTFEGIRDTRSEDAILFGAGFDLSALLHSAFLSSPPSHPYCRIRKWLNCRCVGSYVCPRADLVSLNADDIQLD